MEYEKNTVELQASLMILLDDLKTKSDFFFFRTQKARQKNSDARKLVCAALVGFKNFDSDH